MKYLNKIIILGIVFLFLVGNIGCERQKPSPTLTPTPVPIPTYLTEEEFCSACHRELVEDFTHNRQLHPYISCHYCHGLHLTKQQKSRCKAGFGYKWVCLTCHQELFSK